MPYKIIRKQVGSLQRQVAFFFCDNLKDDILDEVVGEEQLSPAGNHDMSMSSADQQSASRPNSDRPSADQPSASRPNAERPSADRLSTEQPSAGGPSAESTIQRTQMKDKQKDSSDNGLLLLAEISGSIQERINQPKPTEFSQPQQGGLCDVQKTPDPPQLEKCDLMNRATPGLAGQGTPCDGVKDTPEPPILEQESEVCDGIMIEDVGYDAMLDLCQDLSDSSSPSLHTDNTEKPSQTVPGSSSSLKLNTRESPSLTVTSNKDKSASNSSSPSIQPDIAKIPSQTVSPSNGANMPISSSPVLNSHTAKSPSQTVTSCKDSDMADSSSPSVHSETTDSPSQTMTPCKDENLSFSSPPSLESNSVEKPSQTIAVKLMSPKPAGITLANSLPELSVSLVRTPVRPRYFVVTEDISPASSNRVLSSTPRLNPKVPRYTLAEELYDNTMTKDKPSTPVANNSLSTPLAETSPISQYPPSQSINQPEPRTLVASKSNSTPLAERFPISQSPASQPQALPSINQPEAPRTPVTSMRARAPLVHESLASCSTDQPESCTPEGNVKAHTPSVDKSPLSHSTDQSEPSTPEVNIKAPALVSTDQPGPSTEQTPQLEQEVDSTPENLPQEQLENIPQKPKNNSSIQSDSSATQKQTIGSMVVTAESSNRCSNLPKSVLDKKRHFNRKRQCSKNTANLAKAIRQTDVINFSINVKDKDNSPTPSVSEDNSEKVLIVHAKRKFTVMPPPPINLLKTDFHPFDETVAFSKTASNTVNIPRCLPQKDLVKDVSVTPKRNRLMNSEAIPGSGISTSPRIQKEWSDIIEKQPRVMLEPLSEIPLNIRIVAKTQGNLLFCINFRDIQFVRPLSRIQVEPYDLSGIIWGWV